MSKKATSKKKTEKDEQIIDEEIQNKEQVEETAEEAKEDKAEEAKAESSEEKKEETQEKKEAEQPKEENIDYKDRYLRLAADFDNYRRRTLKEKADLIKTAGESILKDILPLVDDLERAIKAFDNIEDADANIEGMRLVFNKYNDFLKNKGVKRIEAQNMDFNPDEHEAITKFPAPDESLKGKVIDVVENGYYLHDKIIKYAKVVVGE